MTDQELADLIEHYGPALSKAWARRPSDSTILVFCHIARPEARSVLDGCEAEAVDRAFAQALAHDSLAMIAFFLTWQAIDDLARGTPDQRQVAKAVRDTSMLVPAAAVPLLVLQPGGFNKLIPWYPPQNAASDLAAIVEGEQG